MHQFLIIGHEINETPSEYQEKTSIKHLHHQNHLQILFCRQRLGRCFLTGSPLSLCYNSTPFQGSKSSTLYQRASGVWSPVLLCTQRVSDLIRPRGLLSIRLTPTVIGHKKQKQQKGNLHFWKVGKVQAWRTYF